MGSPLSPVLADLFMEAFELDTIENGDLHPNLWLHYIDDTLWLGPTARQHPKSSSITWTVNIHASTSPWNKNKTDLLPHRQVTRQLYGILRHLTRQDDGTLAHTVHRKPTHTDRYLHNSSFHHLRFKSAVCNTLACRAFNTCEKGSLKQELHHIKTSPQLDGYKTFNLSKPKTSLNPDERPEFKGCNHPPIGHTSHNLQRIFSQAQVKTFHRAPSKIQVSLHTHKEKQDTQDRAGVYHIPCDCGIVHIGETGHNISTRVKKWPTMLIRWKPKEILPQCMGPVLIDETK